MGTGRVTKFKWAQGGLQSSTSSVITRTIFFIFVNFWESVRKQELKVYFCILSHSESFTYLWTFKNQAILKNIFNTHNFDRFFLFSPQITLFSRKILIDIFLTAVKTTMMNRILRHFNAGMSNNKRLFCVLYILKTLVLNINFSDQILNSVQLRVSVDV